MALDATALVDMATAKDFLVAPGQSDDAMIEAMINRATDLCESWCNRLFKQRALTALRLRGPCSTVLMLRGVPVKTDAAVTVSVAGTAQTVWRIEADGDPKDFDVMVASFDPELGRGPDHLYRRAGWGPGLSSQPYNVLLGYTGGFATIPDDLQQACLYVVKKLVGDWKRQLAGVVQASSPIGGSLQFEGSPIPLEAQRWLAPYRFIAVA